MSAFSESGSSRVNRRSVLEVAHPNYRDRRKGRYPTGFAHADRSGLWFGPGDVVVLANSTWLGMTSACVDMIEEVALYRSRSVLVFGTDAGVDALCHFRIEPAVRESLRVSRNLRVAREDKARSVSLENTYREAPIQFNQQAGLTMDQVFAIVEKATFYKGRVGLVVVSDLDEMDLQFDGASQEDRYVKAFAALRVLATELRCPMLILAGAKRFSEVGVPRHDRSGLYNFLWSGHIKPVADLTLYVSSHDVYRINR